MRKHKSFCIITVYRQRPRLQLQYKTNPYSFLNKVDFVGLQLLNVVHLLLCSVCQSSSTQYKKEQQWPNIIWVTGYAEIEVGFALVQVYLAHNFHQI